MSKPNHGKAPQEQMENLHGALAEALAKKIASGDATAADLAVARQFLKDNGIDAIPQHGTPLGNLAGMPFINSDQEDQEESDTQ